MGVFGRLGVIFGMVWLVSAGADPGEIVEAGAELALRVILTAPGIVTPPQTPSSLAEREPKAFNTVRTYGTVKCFQLITQAAKNSTAVLRSTPARALGDSE